MRQTVSDLKVLVPTITDRLKALQGQVVAIQRNTSDEALPVSTPTTSANASSDDDWESIKKWWSDARDHLEAIIDNEDGRRTRKYEDMTRYDYTPIIDNLLSDEFIDLAAAKNARAMNEEFLSLRNRKRPITDEVKGNFKKWKSDFDRAIRIFRSARTSPQPSSPPPGANGQLQSNALA
jgi:hypothetical protein